MNKLLQIVFISIPILVVFMMLVGGSEFDTISNDRLECHPDRSPVCIDWNRGIILEEEVIRS